jgi:ABC-type polysaccharide/polyol phosphate transport system ATPase subunit
MSSIIRVDDVSMMFNLSSERIDNIKEYLIRLMKGNLMFKEFWALKHISFELEKGDSLGVIGLNGSGKSTLLKLLAGVLKPSEGSVYTGGAIAPLIELGAGFDEDLSAEENIYLNGSILGYSKEYMQSKYNDIVKFAELEEFTQIPLKNFSSGMKARLGFAVATMNVPDILILDEVLSVGDFKFQEKSFNRTQEILNSGATVMFVSHSVEQVKKICNKALWLENGQMKMFGDSDEVCHAYVNQA